jgi:hypothetical protein
MSVEYPLDGCPNQHPYGSKEAAMKGTKDEPERDDDLDLGETDEDTDAVLPESLEEAYPEAIGEEDDRED